MRGSMLWWGEMIGVFLEAIGGMTWISATRKKKAKFLESSYKREDMQTIRDMLAAGKIVPFIDRSFSLSDVPAAIAHLETRNVRGKVVIDI
eukprot:FN602293.1.p1 GENE.FN602293.1~~FN602293.1.p1  ORF type:complete len:91 (+),score=10.01 FN602293.1:110-382(+)